MIRKLLIFMSFILSFCVGTALKDSAFVLLEPVIFPVSYIKVIDTPTYGKENIKLILDFFNELGDNKIVKYKNDQILARPISIYEKDFESLITLGDAAYSMFSCRIRLSKDMKSDPDKLLRVVIHEYLHCYGYGHLDADGDLMNKFYSPSISAVNIQSYAEDLRGRIDGN